VSPVDGRVTEVETLERGVLEGKAHRIVIRINSLGTYTARSPVEGKINDLRSGDFPSGGYPTQALWVQTDEGDDVVLMFSGYRLGLAPRSIVRFGERLGQGARCAYLRLTRVAEVHIPTGGKVLVAPGDEVAAGRDLIARLPHP
jgi:phosphatidylserine decarboxylase